MKRIAWGMIIFVGLLCLQAGPVLAGDIKIGVLDVKEFQEKSVAFQKIRGELKGKFEALQKKLENEKNALLKLEEDFRKQNMMLSLDAKDDKKRALDKKRRYYKYLYEDLSEQMKDAERDATRRVLQELEGVVQEIAEKEGYTIIMERSTPGMIFVQDAVKITDKVIQAYDKRSGS